MGLREIALNTVQVYAKQMEPKESAKFIRFMIAECKKLLRVYDPKLQAKTPNQNKYWHGCVVPFIAEEMGHDPHLKPEYNMVREALKDECGMRSKISYGGQERLIIKSIADYTVEDYSRLIEACGVLCEKLYNCRPPAPETDKAKDMIDEYGTMR